MHNFINKLRIQQETSTDECKHHNIYIGWQPTKLRHLTNSKPITKHQIPKKKRTCQILTRSLRFKFVCSSLKKRRRRRNSHTAHVRIIRAICTITFQNWSNSHHQTQVVSHHQGQLLRLNKIYNQKMKQKKRATCQPNSSPTKVACYPTPNN